MPKLAGTLLVVLLVLAAPLFSTARLVAENVPSMTPRRGLLKANQPSKIAVDMMHVDHVDSPHRQPNLTLLQRAQGAAKRSKQRLSYLSSKISGRRKLQASDVYTSPVGHASEQYDYVMQIMVGTPARKFLTMMDTGSDLVWLQCTPCATCFTEPDPNYDPTASSTYKPMNCSAPFCVDLVNDGQASCPATGNSCEYNYTYGSGDHFSAGSMAYETFTFQTTDGSTNELNIGFGCGTDQDGPSGSFGDSSYDGFVGLGDGPLSLASQLGQSIGNVFSYCLVSYNSATTKMSSLLLGSAGSSSLNYTTLVANRFNPTFYYVNLVGITVNDVAVIYPTGTFDIDPNTGAGGFILDSGTTLTILVDAAYTPFRAAIAAAVSYPTATIASFDLCYDTSSVSSPAFPTVGFQLDGLDLSFAASNIFLAVEDATYCMFFTSTSTSLSIFGNVQQQNWEIAYDRANERVGFAPATC